MYTIQYSSDPHFVEGPPVFLSLRSETFRQAPALPPHSLMASRGVQSSCQGHPNGVKFCCQGHQKGVKFDCLGHRNEVKFVCRGHKME